MIIKIETESYNHKRFSRPWVAKVDFSTPKGDLEFGDWTGDHYNGGEGILSIEANPGDFIAQGQKDTRQPRNSAATYFLVTPVGDLKKIGDKGKAYKYYLDNQDSVAPNYDKLIAEKNVLLARIAEIDKILNN